MPRVPAPVQQGTPVRPPCGQHHGRSKYMRLFLSRICQNVSCDDCHYRKKPRIADITQGDYWRVSKYHPEMNDNKGTSVVLLNTTPGICYLNPSPIKSSNAILRSKTPSPAIPASSVPANRTPSAPNSSPTWTNIPSTS